MQSLQVLPQRADRRSTLDCCTIIGQRESRISNFRLLILPPVGVPPVSSPRRRGGTEKIRWGEGETWRQGDFDTGIQGDTTIRGDRIMPRL